jgi:hypothetical protein
MDEINRPESAPETPESVVPNPAVTPEQAPVSADIPEPVAPPEQAASPVTEPSGSAEPTEPEVLFIGPLPMPEPEPMVLPAKAVCVWCGHKVKYTSDEQAREHFAYCSADCKAEMDNVFADDHERAFNKSQRLKKTTPRNAPPWVKGKAKKKPAASGSQQLQALQP